MYPHTPTHARSAPLELFLQSLAEELLRVMQQIQLFSVLQFGTRIVLLDRLALYLLLARPIQFENPHLSYGMWQGARLRPIQKPIAICSEILPFLCTYTLPHAHSAPLQLFLQSLAKEFLCVVQQNQWLSVLQFRTRIVFRIGRLSTFY